MQQELEEHILSLEEMLLRPDVRRSAEMLEELIAEDFIEFGSAGKVYNKRDMLHELPKLTPEVMTIRAFRTRMLSPDVVLSTYSVVSGDPLGSDKKGSLRSSIWKSSEGRWQILFHQGTWVDAGRM